MPLVPLLHGHIGPPPPTPGAVCQEPAADRGMSPLATSAFDRVPGTPYLTDCAPGVAVHQYRPGAGLST